MLYHIHNGLPLFGTRVFFYINCIHFAQQSSPEIALAYYMLAMVYSLSRTN
jgi:hypothetical protein